MIRIFLFLSLFNTDTSSDELNYKSLREEIEKCGIKHPDIVYAQAMVETGNLKCKNCSMDRNNLFGFLTKKGYIWYKTWMESVRKYAEWQSKYFKSKSNSDDAYYSFLKKIGYATAKNYIPTVKNRVRDYRKNGF